MQNLPSVDVTMSERDLWVFSNVPNQVDSLLDVGCYDAHVSEQLLQKSPLVAGVDVDMLGLKQGKSKRVGVALACASAVNLPFPDSCFDCVVLSETLEHLPADLESHVMSEISRVLGKPGYLILTVPHAGLFQILDPMNLRRNVRQAARKLGFEGLFPALRKSAQADSKGHKHYSVRELLDLLEPHYRIETIYRNSLILYPLSLLMGILPSRFLDNDTVRKMRVRMRTWDYDHGFGNASYNVGIVATTIDSTSSN